MSAHPVRNAAAGLLALALLATGTIAGAQPGTTGTKTKKPPRKVPGVVVAHVTSDTRTYIGSPSLAVLPGGKYVVSHDFFGPGSTYNRTVVYGSENRGTSWTKLAEMEGQWWSTLFRHRDALYLLGTTREYGQLVIRRSDDGGRTWTTPADAESGLLRPEDQYHCAPVPVTSWRGRLWRAVEHRDPATSWGITFRAGMMSAPEDADLLKASSWTFSNFLPGDRQWLGGKFGGWLEGNAVVSPDDQMLNLLRVHWPDMPEKAAVVRVSPDGKTVSFDPEDPGSGFIDFPGGAKKFTIRYDPETRLYWTLASIVQQKDVGKKGPDRIRNTLGLTCSRDLRQWEVRDILLHHPDVARHGFQYVDWLFEGDDLIALCRTAYDDKAGGARNGHDANFLTFHRIRDFRTRGEAEEER